MVSNAMVSNAMVKPLILLALLLCYVDSSTSGQQGAPDSEQPAAEEEHQEVSLADGGIRLHVPRTWQPRTPRVRIIEREFAIGPAADGQQTADDQKAADDEEKNARLTMMSALGTVEQNIERWQAQFLQPDGTSTKDRTRLETMTIDGHTIHLVDLSGTYQDRRGPFAPVVSRERYRMLGAVLPTKRYGQYFFKLYGPQQTVARGAEAFREMLKSVRVNE